MKTDPIMRVASTPLPPSVCQKEKKILPHMWRTFLYVYCLVVGTMDQLKNLNPNWTTNLKKILNSTNTTWQGDSCVCGCKINKYQNQTNCCLCLFYLIMFLWHHKGAVSTQQCQMTCPTICFDLSSEKKKIKFHFVCKIIVFLQL